MTRYVMSRKEVSQVLERRLATIPMHERRPRRSRLQASMMYVEFSLRVKSNINAKK